MTNINPRQEKLLKELVTLDPKLVVRWGEDRGVARLLKGRLSSARRREQPETLLRAILKEYGLLLGPPYIMVNYRFVGTQKVGEGGYRIKATQTYKGIPVHGTALSVFVDPRQGVRRIQSSFWSSARIAAEQKKTESQVRRRLHSRLLKARVGTDRRFKRQQVVSISLAREPPPRKRLRSGAGSSSPRPR